MRTREILQQRKRLKALHKDFTDKLKQLEVDMKLLQKECSHPEPYHIYHARQVAEDDPWNECTACGKIW